MNPIAALIFFGFAFAVKSAFSYLYSIVSKPNNAENKDCNDCNPALERLCDANCC